MNARIVKSICTKTYEIAIIEDETGKYHIKGIDLQTEQELVDVSSTYDFNNANFIFDKLVMQLEGH